MQPDKLFRDNSTNVNSGNANSPCGIVPDRPNDIPALLVWFRMEEVSFRWEEKKLVFAQFKGTYNRRSLVSVVIHSGISPSMVASELRMRL